MTHAVRRATLWLLLVTSVACTRAAPPARSGAGKPRRVRSGHMGKGVEEAPCTAIYKNKCFSSADDACAFAGCADQRCEVLPTKPASVSCADMR